MSFQRYYPPFLKEETREFYLAVPDGEGCPAHVSHVHNLSHYEWLPERQEMIMHLKNGTSSIRPDMKMIDGRLNVKCIDVKLLKAKDNE